MCIGVSTLYAPPTIYFAFTPDKCCHYQNFAHTIIWPRVHSVDIKTVFPELDPDDHTSTPVRGRVVCTYSGSSNLSILERWVIRRWHSPPANPNHQRPPFQKYVSWRDTKWFGWFCWFWNLKNYRLKDRLGGQWTLWISVTLFCWHSFLPFCCGV